MTTITAAMLRARRACWDQVALFEATFGASVELTPETWARAQAAGLEVAWCEALLRDAELAEYKRVCDAARAEYERARAPELAEYRRVCDAAWAKYDALLRAPELAEYRRVRCAAWAEYERVSAPAVAEYERVRDAALLTALLAQGDA